MEYEDMKTDLKVIAMLNKNGRLCIRQGHISIEPEVNNKDNVLLTWGSAASMAIRRWWNQDNRQSALLKVQSLLMKCYDVINKIDLKEQIELKKLCKDAAEGLINLQHTYEHDAAVKARIIVYIENFEKISEYN